MNLTDRVNNELKEAMRSKESNRLAAIRALRNEIIKLNKSGDKSEVRDDDVIKLVKSQIKQRQDSISMFKKAGRQDLIDVEESQMLVLETFLPEQLSSEKLEKLVESAVSKVDAVSIKDMGKVMKCVLGLIQETGKDADNRTVSELVKVKINTLITT